MKRNLAVMAAVIVTIFTIGMSVRAASEWLESVYRNDSITCTGFLNNFTVSYTNTTGSKVALASVFAMCVTATNAWDITLINNNQTNLLVLPTILNTITNNIKYDGTGNVPLGQNGIVQINGKVRTNAVAPVVQWAIHLK